MNTYTWKINSLAVQDVGGLSQVAVFATFTVTATNELGGTSSVSYAVDLLPADAANFTPYASITEAQAVAWVKAAMDAPGKMGVAGVEAELDAALAAQGPAPVVAALPWAE